MFIHLLTWFIQNVENSVETVESPSAEIHFLLSTVKFNKSIQIEQTFFSLFFL